MSQIQLPEEIIKTTSKKEVVLQIGITFFLVLSLNFLFLLYLNKYNNRDWIALSHLKWELLKKAKHKPDWLIIGDSSGNQGVQTDPFETELNESAINLCTIGPMLTIDDSWMLDYCIKKYGPPKNVLLIHVYDVWHRGFDEIVFGENPWSTVFSENLQPNLPLTFKQKIKMFFFNYMPLYSKQKSAMDLITRRSKFFEPAVVLQKNGYNARTKPSISDVERDAKTHFEFVKDSIFSISSYCQLGLNQIIQSAVKYNINLYIANSPVYNKLGKDSLFLNYYADVSNTIRKNIGENKNIHFLDTLRLYPAHEMQNADHLIDGAANKYTKQLIKDIKVIRGLKQ